MRCSVVVSLLLILPHAAHGLSYWLDKSCKEDKKLTPPPDIPEIDSSGRDRWDLLFSEISATGKSAKERLLNVDKDADFTRAFNTLFNNDDNAGINDPVDLNGEIPKALEGYFLGLEGLALEADQLKADLRIYCDNDARWVEKTDSTGGKDTENHLSTKDRGCIEDKAFATVYIDKLDDDEDENSRNQNRATMTICDLSFRKVTRGWYLFSDIPASLDLGHPRLNPPPMTFITSTFTALLLHEISHARPFLTKDSAEEDSYGWHNVANMEVDAARDNAESFMYLAILAMFQDRKYVLNRDMASTRSGDLEKYDDII